MSKIPESTQKRISPEFQKRLLELIGERGLSKYEFASSIKISREVITRATIYAIIPSLRSLIKIADFLNISLEYLLGEINNNNFYRSDISITFHERLKQLADDKNVKYSKIAHKMPFAENLFYEWQREGTLPSLEYLTALAQYFEVSIDYLLGRTDDKHN